MTAIKTDIGIGPQHWFSESKWSQYSETPFEVHLLCFVLNLKNLIPGQPTNSLTQFTINYRPSKSKEDIRIRKKFSTVKGHF